MPIIQEQLKKLEDLEKLEDLKDLTNDLLRDIMKSRMNNGDGKLLNKINPDVVFYYIKQKIINLW